MYGLGLGQLGRVGGKTWNERTALWPIGTEPGLWIDPSTTSASYQDSAGTTPISAIGTLADSSNPVGLQLDRKYGPVLGPELVTNGDFSGGTTGWVASGSTLSEASGALLVTSTASGAASAGQNISGLVVGKTYQLKGTYRLVSGSSTCLLSVSDGGGNAFLSTGTGATPVSFVGNWVARYTTAGINCRAGNAPGAGEIYEFDNISVREIPGLHLSQATSAARPFASARKNVLVATATLSTQSVTVIAAPYTISFTGGGTITGSGAYAGALTNGQTFTPTAGSLTLTVAGSVTLAQLEQGSSVTSYQAVVSDADYNAAGFPIYDKFDAVDDALLSATVAAGVVGNSNMDCLIAVRRDSATQAVAGIATLDGAAPYIGVAQAGGVYVCHFGAGTPTVWVDGVQLSGGTSVTAETLHTALTVGVFHILEFRGVDMSAWTKVLLGGFLGYFLKGACGGIMLFPAASAADRDKARTRLAAKVGLVL